MNKRRKRIVASVGIIIIIVASFSMGYIQYAVAYMGCGQRPVQAIGTEGQGSYLLPGDFSYGPTTFAGYYCTEQNARDNGLERSLLR